MGTHLLLKVKWRTLGINRPKCVILVGRIESPTGRNSGGQCVLKACSDRVRTERGVGRSCSSRLNILLPNQLLWVSYAFVLFLLFDSVVELTNNFITVSPENG